MDILSLAGPWAYPLAVVALGLAISVVRALLTIRSAGPVPPAGPPHHATVAWGALGAVVGLMGTVVGVGRLGEGLRSVVGTEDADVVRVLDILREGSMVAATPAAVGLGLLSLSLLSWLGLGFLLNRRAADEV